jgi:undecaprenyl-diphosphatase
MGREAVGLAGALLISLGAFALLATAVTLNFALGWDTEVLRFAERHYHASIVDAFNTVVWVTIALGAAVAGGAMAVALARRRPGRAVFWVLVAAGVPLLDVLLKESFRRPALGGHEGSYSFPSGNAMGSAAIVAAIFLLCSSCRRRRVLAAAVLFLVAYGAVLVYAWWHYPTDVVAGWCVGLAWVTSLWLVIGRSAR